MGPQLADALQCFVVREYEELHGLGTRRESHKREWRISDDFAQVKEPRHSETISDENRYLYCSTRH